MCPPLTVRQIKGKLGYGSSIKLAKACAFIWFTAISEIPKAKAILLKTVYQIDDILETPEPEVDLVNFGDSSIDLIVRYWTAPSQAVVRRFQSEAIMAIKAAFDAADINIPYPIRTVYHYDQQEFNDYLPNNSKEYANYR